MALLESLQLNPARLRRWIFNVGTSYGDLAVGGAIYLMLTPLLIRSLGVETYALWLISHVITFYIGLLDFGFGQAQVRFHARYAAKARVNLVHRLVATTTASLLITGTIASLLVLAVAFSPIHTLFDMSAALESDLRLVLIILGINLLLNMPSSTLEKVYEGEQRFDIRNIRSIALRLVTAGLQVAFLLQGYGVVALALLELTATVIRIVIDVLIVHRLLPGLFNLSRLRVDRRIFQSMLPFAVWAFVDDVIVEGAEHMEKFLVVLFLPMAMLTPYALCTAIAGVLILAVRPVAETFFPMAAGLHAQGRRTDLSRLLLAGTKGVTALAVPAAVFLMFFGSPLLQVWVPEAWEMVPPGLVQLVVTHILFFVYFWTGTVMLMAMSLVRFVALLTAIQVAVAVLFMMLLVPMYGLLGFAGATLLSNLLVGFALLLPAIGRVSDLSLGPFLVSTLGRLVLAAVPVVLAAGSVRWAEIADGWPLLAIGALVVGTVYLPSFLWLGTNDEEYLKYKNAWHSFCDRFANKAAGPAT